MTPGRKFADAKGSMWVVCSRPARMAEPVIMACNLDSGELVPFVRSMVDHWVDVKLSAVLRWLGEHGPKPEDSDAGIRLDEGPPMRLKFGCTCSPSPWDDPRCEVHKVYP